MVDIYTDGACKGNPGPGGWGAVILRDGAKKTLQGGERDTTNNRMEMTAVIEGLRKLPEQEQVTIHSDSQYVADGVNFNMPNWKQQGWKRSDGKAVMNQDLWQRLDEAMRRSTAEFCWQPKDRRGATRPNLERDKYGRKRARVLAQVEAQKQKPRNKGPIGRGAVR